MAAAYTTRDGLQSRALKSAATFVLVAQYYFRTTWAIASLSHEDIFSSVMLAHGP
jgi:hypothetical protein